MRWIDAPATDGTEPEHPAPVLKLAAAAAESAPAASGAAVAATDTDAEQDDSRSGTVWGIAGVVVALAALVLGLLAYRRANQTQA